MTSSAEQREFQQWAQEWQTGAPQEPASEKQIRHYVQRRRGLVWAFLVTDFIVAAIALPFLVYLGVTTDSGAQRLAMLLLASITVGAVSFGWWNWRGVLRASATSVSDYITISEERLRRMRMAWRMAWLVLGAQIAVYALWIPDHLHAGGTPATPGQLRFAWAWLTGFSLAAAAGLVWFGGWLKRDAERFSALRRELE